MQDAEIKEIGLHLRQIQFLITLTVVGLIVITFGYKDPQIGTALKELQLLTKSLRLGFQIARKTSAPSKLSKKAGTPHY